VLVGQAFDLGIVDDLVRVEAIGRNPVQLTRQVHRRPVGQVPAVGQRHAQNGVTGLQESRVDRLVGLGTRMGLHVGVFGAEQRLAAVDGELLGDVDVLAAAVVALARIALGVLVGQHRTLGREHARTSVVLRGDQLDVVFLAGALGFQGRPQFRVEALDGVVGEHGRISSGGQGRGF